MINLGDLEFKAEKEFHHEYLSHYLDVPNWNEYDSVVLCNLLNSVLRERLATAIEINLWKGSSQGKPMWTGNTIWETFCEYSPDHRARLVCIEEVGK